MTSVDFGMLGLDFPDKNSSSLESDLCIEEFENLLQDHNINSQNILDISLQQSGISHNNQMNMEPSWDDDTDDFLKSMLNGPDLSAEIEGITGSVCPSDTSSDSGCPDDRVRTLTSFHYFQLKYLLLYKLFYLLIKKLLKSSYDNSFIPFQKKPTEN